MRGARGFAIVVLLGLFTGCNTILGLEESPARPESDAGSDGPPNGSSLMCAWVFNKHRKVADLSANAGATRLFGPNLVAAPVPGDRLLRVAAWHDPTSGPFDLYTIDAVPTGALPVPEPLGAGEMPIQMLRLDTTTVGILVIGAPLEGGASPAISLYRVADADRQGSAAARVPLLDTSVLGNASEVSALANVGPSGIALVTSYRSGANEFRIALGQSTGGALGAPIVLASDAVDVNVRERGLLTFGGKTHVFTGQPGSPAGPRQFTVEDGATTSHPARSIGGKATFFLAAGASPMGKVNFAFVFLVGDLRLAAMFGGLTSVPYENAPSWIGDDLVSFGRTGAGADELTVLWADAFGHLRVQQKLEQAPAGAKMGPSAFTTAAQLGPLGGVLNAVWAVTLTDADSGEPYDVLYYDQIKCL